MTYVLQVDFKLDGPFGDEMAEAFSDLAKVFMKRKDFCGKFGQRA